MSTLTIADLMENQRGAEVRVTLANEFDSIGVMALGYVPYVSMWASDATSLDPDAARTLGTALLAAARVAEAVR